MPRTSKPCACCRKSPYSPYSPYYPYGGGGTVPPAPPPPVTVACCPTPVERRLWVTIPGSVCFGSRPLDYVPGVNQWQGPTGGNWDGLCDIFNGLTLSCDSGSLNWTMVAATAGPTNCFNPGSFVLTLVSCSPFLITFTCTLTAPCGSGAATGTITT